MIEMIKIYPARRFFGQITVPGDKSISHRAVMASALARGATAVKNLPDCDDCARTTATFRQMGVTIEKRGAEAVVKGNGLRGLAKPAGALNAGESGTTIRLMAGILAGQDFESVLTGEGSLMKRPMRRILEPLSMMGVDIKARAGEYPPITIRGGVVKPITYTLPIPSAQVKSAILFAGLYSKGVTVVKERFKSRDHTERMLRHFGADLKTGPSGIAVRGAKELIPGDVAIPGDISSASFFIVGATMLKGSRLTIKGVSVNPTRSGILKILSRMGAKIAVKNKKGLFEPVADLEISYSRTKGTVIEEGEIPGIIDELPVLFVLASLSKGRTVVKGAGELRSKETDRITSMTENLARMGAGIRADKDEIVIDGAGGLSGSALSSFGDHRTCMAMVIAGLCAKGASHVDETECVNKSFPGFFKVLDMIKE